MALTKQDVRDVLAVYIRAWETQDPDLIVTIFTERATYHERVLEAPIPNRDAIRQYWATKVAQEQANIKAKLLNVYLDGDTSGRRSSTTWFRAFGSGCWRSRCWTSRVGRSRHCGSTGRRRRWARSSTTGDVDRRR